MSSSPAVVTGVPGWLGNRFVNSLLNGLPDVPSLSKPAGRQINLLVTDLDGEFVKQMKVRPEVKVTLGDLRDPDSLSKLLDTASGGTVFHIAGVIHPNSVKEFYDVNVHGTKNLLERAIQAGVKRFVYISSNSPLGVNPDGQHLFNEQSPYNPYMNYGKSKMLAEQAVNAAGDRIETVILRPPWFYGPGQPARQLLFFTMIKNGKAPIIGSGQNKRSMAYVDNICQGMLLADQIEQANGQTYWIADSEPYTMCQIVDTIERLLEEDFRMKVAHKRMHLPDIASEVALALDAMLQGVGLYQQKIHVLSEMNKNISCSIAKARQELGYDPKIALEQGMRTSIKSALDEGMEI